MADSSQFPVWEHNNVKQSLNLIYLWAIRRAEVYIQWYVWRKEIKKRWAQLLRSLSIIFAAIGAVCPLLKTTGFLSENIQWGQWGYVSLAIAGSLICYDKFFGLSSGWMRYIIAQLSLQKAIKEFQYDWTILIVEQESKGSPKYDSLKMIQRLKSFSLQCDGVVQKETDMWIHEFLKNISNLEKNIESIETKMWSSDFLRNISELEKKIQPTVEK